MKHFWFYWYVNFQPKWYHYLLPSIGGDEYGRRVIVWPIHPFGWVVVPYRTCGCMDCELMRRQTARFAREALDERGKDV